MARCSGHLLKFHVRQTVFLAAYAPVQNGGVSPSGKGGSLWERWLVALCLTHLSIRIHSVPCCLLMHHYQVSDNSLHTSCVNLHSPLVPSA